MKCPVVLSTVILLLPVLLEFSQAFSFRPSSFVFTEEEISNATKSTKRPSRIAFPTSAPNTQANGSVSAASASILKNIFTKFVTTARTTARTTPPPTPRTENATTPTPKTGAKQNETQPQISLNSTLQILDLVQGESLGNQTNATVIPEIKCKPESQPKASTSYLSDETIRSKLCSDISPGNLSRGHRFDLDVKVCSETGKKSHCGKNMIFYSFSGNSIFGHCDCDYSSKIPLFYHNDTGRCYFMYQQGFCKEDEWIEMVKENGKVVCTKNKCYNSGRVKFGAPSLASRDIAPEYVPLGGDGPCVQLNQVNKQYCKQKGNVVAFRWPLQFYPSCGEPLPTPLTLPPTQLPSNTSLPGLGMPSLRFLGSVPSLECSPGSYLSAIGSCQPDWEFD